MKGFILDYINENEYKKLERALKKYNMLLQNITISSDIKNYLNNNRQM